MSSSVRVADQRTLIHLGADSHWFTLLPCICSHSLTKFYTSLNIKSFIIEQKCTLAGDRWGREGCRQKNDEWQHSAYKGCSRAQRSCIFNVPFACEFNPSDTMPQLLEKDANIGHQQKQDLQSNAKYLILIYLNTSRGSWDAVCILYMQVCIITTQFLFFTLGCKSTYFTQIYNGLILGQYSRKYVIIRKKQQKSTL